MTVEIHLHFGLLCAFYRLETVCVHECDAGVLSIMAIFYLKIDKVDYRYLCLCDGYEPIFRVNQSFLELVS